MVDHLEQGLDEESRPLQIISVSTQAAVSIPVRKFELELMTRKLKQQSATNGAHRLSKEQSLCPRE